MSLFSDLIGQGRIRNREDLRRVYRRLQKRLHPDSAPPGAGGPSSAVDFEVLRRELAEAEGLLAELGSGAAAGEAEAPSPAPPPPGTPAGRAGPGEAAARFDPGLLYGELRDLVARGLPVNPRAVSRNRAYRRCIATVSTQLALLTGDEGRFARLDAEMRAIKYGSLRLQYYVMQVLWNGLDWRLYGYGWIRDAALRDYGVVRANLEALGLEATGALLALIVDAERPPARGAPPSSR